MYKGQPWTIADTHRHWRAVNGPDHYRAASREAPRGSRIGRALCVPERCGTWNWRSCTGPSGQQAGIDGIAQRRGYAHRCLTRAPTG